ncbi:MAG: hypothetical protein AVDCRST_MAG89-4686, partial [uncultured Gemmatimonadetes bacterium]
EEDFRDRRDGGGHAGRERAGAGVRQLSHGGQRLLAGRPHRLPGGPGLVRRGRVVQRARPALGVRRAQRDLAGRRRFGGRGRVLRRARVRDAAAGVDAGSAVQRVPAGAPGVPGHGRRLVRRHPGGAGLRRHAGDLAGRTDHLAVRDPAGGVLALLSRERRGGRRDRHQLRRARRRRGDLWDVLRGRRAQLPRGGQLGLGVRAARRGALL